jgi:hypothetical protein
MTDLERLARNLGVETEVGIEVFCKGRTGEALEDLPAATSTDWAAARAQARTIREGLRALETRAKERARAGTGAATAAAPATAPEPVKHEDFEQGMNDLARTLGLSEAAAKAFASGRR